MRPVYWPADVLVALGLQERRSAGHQLAVSLGFAAGGALLGAGVVLWGSAARERARLKKLVMDDLMRREAESS